ncbi:MAG TPA: hypothetical protein VJ303_14830 [Steroidobacteraceae bacterium]|jgi:hypothetical protein|nr:hypothetical protein [Steroidobacteraceae bacterium]
MSAGQSASTQVRRTAPAAPARPTQAPLARNTQQFAFAAASADDEIRLNLSDIPRIQPDTEMRVEGFKPTLLSRLLDLVMPLR